ncbi:MAG: hypothetical protein JW874_10855, partial [Spirochaetales bacterium]|nr:hypothetical protein [Spirochaetales bacterium]
KHVSFWKSPDGKLHVDYPPGFILMGSFGTGMLFSPESVRDSLCGKDGYPGSLVKGKNASRARELLEAGGELPYSYGYYLYMCGRCRRLHRRFYFRIEHGGGYFEHDYRCGKCRGGLKPVIMDCGSWKYEDIKPVVLKDFDGNSVEWECPVCGSSKLTGRLWGMWD